MKNTSLDRFNGLCKIFGNKISANERAGDIVLQLQCMEANHITNEMGMDGTYENLHVFSNAEKSDPDAITKRLREMHMDGTFENLGVIGNTEISHHDKNRPTGMLSSSNPPKEMLETLPKMDGSAKAMADEKEDDIKSLESALNALQAMPDMDEELIMDACDLLEDNKKAKIFLTLDVNMRKKWLVRKLRP